MWGNKAHLCTQLSSGHQPSWRRYQCPRSTVRSSLASDSVSTSFVGSRRKRDLTSFLLSLLHPVCGNYDPADRIEMWALLSITPLVLPCHPALWKHLDIMRKMDQKGMLLPQVSFSVLLRSSPSVTPNPLSWRTRSGVEARAWDVECLFDLLSSSEGHLPDASW